MDLDSFQFRPRVISTCSTLAAMAAALFVLAAPLHAQQSRNVTLLANLHLYTDDYSACWGYIHNDGREYVISTTEKGASIVRLTDPAHPVEVKFINLRDSFWHEAKQYKEWVYVTTEVFNGFPSERGFEIISMQDPDHPRLIDSGPSGISHVHTITVDPDRGLLYLNGADQVNFTAFGSMRILSLADPENPVEIGVYPRYVHDLHIRGT